MQKTASDFIREAVIQAVSEKNDEAAFGLMKILAAQDRVQVLIAPSSPLETLPSTSSSPTNSFHSVEFWVGVIRSSFIPFVQQYGRIKFTSHELNNWIERSYSSELTEVDTELTKRHCKPRWRERVSEALSTLKHQGILEAEAYSKSYSIIAPRLAALITEHE